MRQRYHSLGNIHGVVRGSNVSVSIPTSQVQAKTVAELEARPVVAGTYVITLPAPSSTLARTCRGLQDVQFWLWKVLRVLQPGDALPANTRHATTASTTTYESQLHVNVAPLLKNQPFKPLWDKMAEAHFLKTHKEKVRGTQPSSTADPQSPKMHVPLIAMLRPENIICGGFTLTATQRLPAVARLFLKLGDGTPLSVVAAQR